MRNRFKVYLPFTLNEIKRNFAYKGSFYLFIVCSMFNVFISYYLWGAIYNSSDTGNMGGFNRHEMIIYIFMAYVTANMVNVGMINYIEDDIKDGSVVMALIKPIDYRLSLMFRSFGVSVYRMVAPSVLVWIALEVCRLYRWKDDGFSWQRTLLYVVSLMFSVLIYQLFDFCFGLIAFITTYLFGLKMAKEAVFLLLTGQLIPITFFPEIIQNVLKILPFQTMLYTPVMIYLGKYTGTDLYVALIQQGVWIVILYVLGQVLWKRIEKRMIVLGG